MVVLEKPTVKASTAPTKVRWTSDQYLRLLDDGFFSEQYRTELIDGEITVMSVPGQAHAFALAVLHEWLVSQLPDNFRVFAGSGLSVVDSVTAPDLMMVRLPVANTNRPVASESVIFVAEISQSTQDYDRSSKRRLYAEAGFPSTGYLI